MALHWIRGLVFTVVIYTLMAVYAVAFAPFAIYDRAYAFAACRFYCRSVRWLARWMVGIETEVRGTPPTDEVMIAAKHQSFLDIMLIFGAIPRGKFIMKKELTYTPFIGQYALRLGCVPVDRGKRGAAIAKMLDDVKKDADAAGQLIIYPQGTRVPPGESKPYKAGTGALYRQLGQTCVPVATNVGHFWPRRGIIKRPGLAIVEFLEPIEPGLEVAEFMALLEERVETASDRLTSETTGN